MKTRMLVPLLITVFLSSLIISVTISHSKDLRGIDIQKRNSGIIVGLRGNGVVEAGKGGQQLLTFGAECPDGATIIVHKDSTTEILFDERALVTIGSDSEIQILDISPKEIKISLTKGLLTVAAVKHALFTVQTPKAKITTQGGLLQANVPTSPTPSHSRLNSQGKLRPTFISSVSSPNKYINPASPHETLKVLEGSATITTIKRKAHHTILTEGQHAKLSDTQTFDITEITHLEKSQASFLPATDRHERSPYPTTQLITEKQIAQALFVSRFLTSKFEPENRDEERENEENTILSTTGNFIVPVSNTVSSATRLANLPDFGRSSMTGGPGDVLFTDISGDPIDEGIGGGSTIGNIAIVNQPLNRLVPNGTQRVNLAGSLVTFSGPSDNLPNIDFLARLTYLRPFSVSGASGPNDLDRVPLIEFSNSTASGFGNALTLRSLTDIEVDSTLLEASAPLVSILQGSQVTNSNADFVKLGADDPATARGGIKTVANFLNGDSLIQVGVNSHLDITGNLVNINNGSILNVNNGHLLAVQGSSSIDITGGALVKVGIGSSFSLNGGSLIAFGPGTNNVTISNTSPLCAGCTISTTVPNLDGLPVLFRPGADINNVTVGDNFNPLLGAETVEHQGAVQTLGSFENAANSLVINGDSGALIDIDQGSSVVLSPDAPL